jgi:hypothetical protein
VVFSSISSIQRGSWQWLETEGLLYLQCPLLAGFPHGFFTRHFAGYALSDLTLLLATDAETYRTQQVHGKRVVTPSEMAQEEGERVEADGLVSDGSKQALWVASADCTPALIADLGTGQVGAVHAGWRGTALSILPGAIARFLTTGSQLSDLRVALGPAISGEVYQVSEDVAAQVGATLLPQGINSPIATILDSLWKLEPSPLRPDPEPNKVRLDVRTVNCLQLQQMGLQQTQIAIAPYCTYQQGEHFFSYRRCREKAVQWSGIVSNV